LWQLIAWQQTTLHTLCGHHTVLLLLLLLLLLLQAFNFWVPLLFHFRAELITRCAALLLLMWLGSYKVRSSSSSSSSSRCWPPGGDATMSSKCVIGCLEGLQLSDLFCLHLLALF
jgi:hypothetical protein